MNWNVIKKAVDNGIDSLTDEEYQEYSAIKKSLTPEEWSPIKKAVDSGIDALDESEYSAYTATKGKISGSTAQTAPTAQIASEQPEEGLQWGAVAESLFPRLVREGETDYTPSNVAKNIGLGVMDASTMLGRHTKELLGLGRAEDVGIDPNAGTMTQLGQGVLNDPLLMFGGGASKGALMATEKVFPTMGKLGQGLVGSSLAGAGLGMGSNAILSSNNETDFAPIESAGMGALGGALGAGAGAVGSKIVQKMGLGTPEAIAPKTMAEQAKYDQMPVSEKIDYNFEQMAKSMGMTKKEAGQMPNEIQTLAQAGKFGEQEQAQLAQYMNDISNPQNYKEISQLQKAGDRIIKGALQKANEQRVIIGDEFNTIESKAFADQPLNIQPIKDHFSNVVKDMTGYAPSYDEEGALVLEKVRKSAIPKDTELYRTAKSMADYVMNLEDMSPAELRELEIQLKKAYTSSATTENLTEKKKLISEFVRGKADSEDIDEEDGAKSILSMIQDQVAKSPNVTPEEVARYAELRNDYRKALRIEDWIQKQGGKTFEDPNGGETYAQSANFMRRLASGAQDQNANSLAHWYESQGGEDAHTTSRLIIGANAFLRSQGKPYDKRIPHSSAGLKLEVPSTEGIVSKVVSMVTPTPKTPLQSFEKPRSQTAPAKATQKLGSALKGQPTALGAMGATKEQKKPKKQSGNGTLNDVMTRAFKLNPTR